MIVKVVHPDPMAAVNAVYHDTGRAPVATGVHYFDDSPGIANYGDIALAKLTHVFGVTDPTAPGQWPCRFAHWLPEHDQDGLQLVVTTGQIYLMSDRGDTIDRV